MTMSLDSLLQTLRRTFPAEKLFSACVYLALLGSLCIAISFIVSGTDAGDRAAGYLLTAIFAGLNVVATAVYWALYGERFTPTFGMWNVDPRLVWILLWAVVCGFYLADFLEIYLGLPMG